MRIKIRQIFLTALLIFGSRLIGKGQITDTLPFMITLDSVTIEEVRSGFSVNDFIDFVGKDTTFYEAFRNLRRIDYDSRALVRMFDDEGLSKASYTNITHQAVSDKCRSMQFAFESATGDFFDKHHEMNYYTARVFSYIFLYRDTICNNYVVTDNNAGSDSKLEQRKEQLKTLIFQPGKPVDDIPLIKNKMAIFSEEMSQFYDYKIESKNYATGVECYVFTVQKKTDAEDDDVVIHNLTTWFDKKTMQIVSRQYNLSYASAIFDFDVQMDVRLSYINGYLIPSFIKYNGYWDIPLRKPEVGSVEIFVW